MPSSDHIPLQAEIDVDSNCAFNFIDVNACPRDIVSYKGSQINVLQMIYINIVAQHTIFLVIFM